MIQTSRRLHSFLYEAVQNFELLINIQDQIKKKPLAVDVFFKAYLTQIFSKFLQTFTDGKIRILTISNSS
jgi:hypothetical protein